MFRLVLRVVLVHVSEPWDSFILSAINEIAMTEYQQQCCNRLRKTREPWPVTPTPPLAVCFSADWLVLPIRWHVSPSSSLLSLSPCSREGFPWLVSGPILKGFVRNRPSNTIHKPSLSNIDLYITTLSWRCLINLYLLQKLACTMASERILQ